MEFHRSVFHIDTHLGMYALFVILERINKCYFAIHARAGRLAVERGPFAWILLNECVQAIDIDHRIACQLARQRVHALTDTLTIPKVSVYLTFVLGSLAIAQANELAHVDDFLLVAGGNGECRLALVDLCAGIERAYIDHSLAGAFAIAIPYLGPFAGIISQLGCPFAGGRDRDDDLAANAVDACFRITVVYYKV